MLMVGLGFMAFAAGGVLAGSLVATLGESLDSAPMWVAMPLGLLLSQVWVLVVLPLLLYGAARFLTIRPWPSALTAAATGQVFSLLFVGATRGFEALTEAPVFFTLQLLVTALGAVLAGVAATRGRARAAEREARAARAAEAKKAEYAEYLKAAEAAADRTSRLP